jgi:BASS family bile acid:Na+ symporter
LPPPVSLAAVPELPEGVLGRIGLGASLALLATVVATLAAPFCLPLLASGLAGADLAFDPLALAARLGLIVGAAAASA